MFFIPTLFDIRLFGIRRCRKPARIKLKDMRWRTETRFTNDDNLSRTTVFCHMRPYSFSHIGLYGLSHDDEYGHIIGMPAK